MPARRRPWRPALCAAVIGALTVVGATAVTTQTVAAAGVLGDRLAVGSVLGAGDSLRSPNGVFTLILQTDGNLVEYAGGRALWSTQTRGAGGVRLGLQTDGNLVLRSAAGPAVWASYRYAPDVAQLVLRDDGGLVTTRADGSEYWGVHARADTLTSGAAIRPGQVLYSADAQYRLTLQTDGNVVLYSVTNVPVWATYTFGPMASLTMQTDGDLVLRDADGRTVFHTATSGATGATLVVTTASAVVGKAPAVAWRSPARAGVVWRGQVLRSGVTLAGGTGRLIMQTDGNLVRRDPSGAAVWATGTASFPGATASMQSDGNLVVRAVTGSALWASGTRGTTATFLQVSPAGLAYLGNATRSPTWIEGPPDWTALARCESGGNPRAVNPAGYYGLYQFSLSTWAAYGGTGNPIDASPAVQTAVAATLYIARGRQPWPTCGVLL